MIISSRKAWLYLPQEKVVYVQKSDSIFQSKFLINFFSGSGKLKDDFIIQFSQPNALDQHGNYQLVLSPKQKTAACNSIQLTVDKDQFYISRLSFDDAMGNSTSLQFSNIRRNKGLTEKLFQFKPPVGVQVLEVP